MNNFQKRMLVFFFGCIGARILLTFTAKNINNHYLPFIGYFLLILSLSEIYQYITKSIKEGPVGGPIWWDHLRPVHAIIYAIGAFMAINKSSNTWYVLLFDTLLGLSSFIYYNYDEIKQNI